MDCVKTEQDDDMSWNDVATSWERGVYPYRTAQDERERLEAIGRSWERVLNFGKSKKQSCRG